MIKVGEAGRDSVEPGVPSNIVTCVRTGCFDREDEPQGERILSKFRLGG